MFTGNYDLILISNDGFRMTKRLRRLSAVEVSGVEVSFLLNLFAIYLSHRDFITGVLNSARNEKTSKGEL